MTQENEQFSVGDTVRVSSHGLEYGIFTRPGRTGIVVRLRNCTRPMVQWEGVKTLSEPYEPEFLEVVRNEP